MAIPKGMKCSATWMGAMLLLNPVPATAQTPSSSTDAPGRSVFSALPVADRRLAAGDAIQGELTGSNPIQGGGRRVEVWELAAEADLRLKVDMQSGDFDPFLFVVGPGLGAGRRDDDGGPGLDASLCFTPGAAEGYRVVAAALDGATGPYVLSVTPSSALGDCAFDDDFLVAVDSLGSLADSTRVLRIDDIVEDILGTGMGIMDGFYGSAWRFDAPLARVRVDMRSSEVDAFLYVSGPGLPDGLADDDGGEGTNARLCFTPSAANGYRIVAAALGQNQNGRFNLSVRRERSEGSCGGLRSRPAPEGNRVAEGQLVTGALDLREADEGIHVWRLMAQPGRRLRVDVQSDDFDPIVSVFGPNPTDSLYDDDGGEGLNARLCFIPSQLDSHRIVVTAWEGGGTYALSVNADEGPQCGMIATASASPEEPVEAPVVARVPGDTPGPGTPADLSVFSMLDAADRHISVGEVIEGSLTERDLLQGGGRRVQVWDLPNARAGQRLRIDFASRSFAPFLYFVGPGLGGGLRGEGGPPALALTDTEGRAWMCVAIIRDAGYRVVASSAGGETGDFTLSVVDLEDTADAPCLPPVLYVATFNAEPGEEYHISYSGEVARTTAAGAQFWGDLLPGSGSYDWVLHEAETGLRFGVGYPARSEPEPGALRYRIEGAHGQVLGHVVPIDRNSEDAQGCLPSHDGRHPYGFRRNDHPR